MGSLWGVCSGAVGELLTLLPLAGGAALMIFLGLVLAPRYVSRGSIAAAAAVVVVRRLDNLQRLLAGTERRPGTVRR